MNELSIIVPNNEKLSASINPDALALKEEALEKSAMVARVSDSRENAAAVEAQSALAELRKAVEKSRIKEKAPALEFGRRIDEQAKSFIADVELEERRIGILISNFFTLEEAKRKAAEQAARLEQERIERQAREEQQRILREQAEREFKERQSALELERKASAEKAESERKIREATNAKQREQAEREAKIRAEQAERERIELERQRALAAAKTHEDLDKAQERASNAQAAVVVTPPPVEKAQGQAIKREPKIISVDVDKVYKFHRNCVDVTAKIGEIKSIIKAGGTVTGVVFEWEMQSQVRSARAPAAIEV